MQLLSYEDIAFILTTSAITIKRDLAHLRRGGLTIPSRGWRPDMGRGSTHKTQILYLYLSGYQFSDIERRTHHSETAVKRYIQDFSKIILLYYKGFSVDQIRITTGFTNRLIGEYKNLYDKHQLKETNALMLSLTALKKQSGVTNKLKFLNRDTRDHSSESLA